MADQLRNILRFAGLVIGVPQTQSHGLVANGVAVSPDLYLPSQGGFTIAVTTTSVTVTRTADATTNAVDVYCVYWHSIDRVFGAFGPSQPSALSNSPFALTPGTIGASFDRTIIVAKAGGDTTTIEGGITAALALNPPVSAAAPALVWVFPGDYTEQPLTVPAGCSVIGWGYNATSIIAAVTTSPLVSLSSQCLVGDLGIEGANGVGGIGVYFAAGGLGLAAGIRDLFVRDCTTGYHITGATTSLFGFNCAAVRTPGSAMTDAFVAAAGAQVNIVNPQVVAVAPFTIARGAVSTGAGTTLDLFSLNMTSCVTAVEADATGEMHCTGGKMETCGTQFHITATGGLIHAFGVGADGTTLYGVYIEAANGTFEGAGNAIRSDQISVAAGASFLSTHISNFSGDKSQMVVGELAIGLPNFPSESIFGEGDSHVRQMTVLRNTNLEVGTWSDITTEMASASGSTANAFPGVGVGNTLYIGGLEKEFPGAKINTTTAIVLGAGGALIWEYWNGAAWTAFNVMACDSIAPYNSYAQAVFGRVAFDQVRFNSLGFTGWATKTLNGISRYWVRCRVSGAITTIPVLQQIKLHTNRTEINADGFIEYFGTAIDLRSIPFDKSHMLPFTGGATPGNVNVAYTANITLAATQNVFANNSLDGLGGSVTVPEGLDTSRPITLRWGWAPLVAPGNPSAVEFQGHYGVIKEGDLVNGTVADAAWSEIIVTTANAQYERIESSEGAAIPTLVPGEQLVFTLSRDATGANPDDTLAGNIVLLNVELYGYFWH